jgi:hypothetical protein
MRKPKSEIRNPEETRNPSSEKWAAPEKIRIPVFEFLSDFGFRISDFVSATRPGLEPGRRPI